MLAYIVILWILIKLQAPIWCYVLTMCGITYNAIDIVANIALKIADKKLEKAQAEFEEAQREYEELKQRVGSNRE